MRRVLFAVVLLVVAGMAWSEGKAEVPAEYTPAKPLVIFVASPTPITGDNVWKSGLVEPFVKKYPFAVIRALGLDISTGGTSAQNAYLAAGIRFILMDYGGRVGELLIPEYALDMTGYMESDYYEEALALVRRNGRILGIPIAGQQAEFFVNLDVLDAAGYKVPPNWTTDDFLEMCAAVKAKVPGVMPFDYFAGNMNADYYFQHIFAWFGAEIYTNNDYTKTTINSPQGLAAFEFLKLLNDKGYLHADVVTRDVTPYMQEMYTGKVASGLTFLNFPTSNIKGMVDQKKLDKPFRWTVVPFPRGPGVKGNPKSFAMQWGIVGPRSDYTVRGKRQPVDAVRDRLTAEFMLGLRDMQNFTTSETGAGIPTRKAEIGVWKDPVEWPAFQASRGPLWDVGLFVKTYTACRSKMHPELQALFQGKKTPKEALESYAAELNKVLAANK